MHNRAALLFNLVAGNVVSRYRRRCLRIDTDMSGQALPSYGFVNNDLSAAMRHLPIIRATWPR
jgi:hypothetical protein